MTEHEKISIVMAMAKKEAAYAYKIVFLNDSDTLADVVLMPVMALRTRNQYTYLSREECSIGDLVTVTARKGRVHLALAIVVEVIDRDDALEDDRVSDPFTGMIIGVCSYPQAIRKGLREYEQMRKEETELRRLIAAEREKVMLEALLSKNPDLLAKVASFREKYPDAAFVKELTHGPSDA